VGRNKSAFGIRDDDWLRGRRWPSDGGGDYLDLFLTDPAARNMTDLQDRCFGGRKSVAPSEVMIWR